MANMEHCFMNKGTEFVRTENIKGFEFRIRTLTNSETGEVIKAEIVRKVEDGKVVVEYGNSLKAEVVRATIGLGGTFEGKSYQKKNEGWEFKDENGNLIPVTFDNVDMLDREIINRINEVMNELDADWKNRREAYLKN